MEKLRTLYLLVFTLILSSKLCEAQFPTIANEIFGPNSYVRGIKNVLGGIVSADNVHKKCIQKTICNEFSDEVVEMTERIDPVKRTVVW